MTTPRVLAIATLAWSLVLVRTWPNAASPPAPPPAVRAPSLLELAIATLRDSDDFWGAQVGYAGLTPPEVLAWRLIFHSPAADSVFKELLLTHGVPARLYALAGLYHMDRAAYARGARALRLRGGQVMTHIGCIGAMRSLASIIEDMDRGWWTQEFITARLIHH